MTSPRISAAKIKQKMVICKGGGSSVRSFTCLKRANTNTVEDLISKTQDEMIKVRNLGRKSLEEVEHKLAMMGLSLASADNQ